MLACTSATRQFPEVEAPSLLEPGRTVNAASSWGGAWLKIIASGLVAFVALVTGTLAQTTVSTVNTGAPSVGIAVNPSQNIIYVTQGDNTLTYIDGWTHTVHKLSDPLAAGTNGASAMATYLNGVYVVNSISNDITTYYVVPNGGGVAQSVIKDPTAVQPVALVGNPNGFGSGYVANKGSNTVSVFVNSGTGLAFSKSIAVGSKPTAIVVNLSTNQYYVANSGDGTVSVIDGGTNTVVNTIDVGNNPVAIAVNPVTNKIYVVSEDSNSITVFSGDGGGTNNINGISNSPAALAINPLTNQVYVATLDGKLYIIDGSTDTVSNSVTVQVGTSPTGQAAVVVDPTTNIAFVSIQGGNVTTVDGGTLVTTNPPVGPGGSALLALNPVTHRAYVDSGSNGVAVLDGATNATTPLLPGQNQPWAVAVNPATNRIYVANNGSNNVTVIDGATNAVVDTVAAGTNPSAIAIDPAKNLIFVTNFGDATVTIIDGATDHTVTQPITITNPDSIAVDPILAKVHGASSGQNSGFNFASNFGSNTWGSGSFSNIGPIAVAANPAAGMTYTLFTDGNLEIDDEVAPHAFITGVCGTTASTPRAMDVNPATNTVFVACSGKEVDAVVSPSGFFGGTVVPIQDPGAVSPVAVAVNPVLNQVYVANAGDGSGNGSVTVIDSTTYTVIANLSIGFTPVGIAVNVSSGKIYVQAKTTAVGLGTIYVIDPVGQYFLGGSLTEATIANLTTQIAVDPINNTVYATGRFDNSVSTIAENKIQASGPATTVQPFANNAWTSSATPTFTFTATSGLSSFGPYAVYFQVDSRIGPWTYAGSTGSAGTFSGPVSAPLAPGFHVVYAYSVSGDETNTLNSSNGSGFQYNPFVGAIASYGFLLAPANAGVPFYPLDYGVQPIGTTGAPQQPLLSNHGGAPLHFTYSISGPNAADFIEVPYTGNDTLCSSLGGVLPPGKFCVVNIAFHPTASSGEGAILIFFDDSLGIPTNAQAVTLIGTSTGSGTNLLTVIAGGSGAGTISDGGSLSCPSPNPCSLSYPTGATVSLSATPAPGAIFYGWAGACTGSGPCTVTMDTDQAVAALFTLATVSSCSAGDTVWIGGPSGNWSNASNWSTGVVPSNGVHVCINNAHSPVSSVTLDTNISIGGLTIDPGNSLTIANNQQLIVSGTISNSGQLNLQSNSSNSLLTFNGAVTLTGGGTITMHQAIGNGQPILNNVNNGSLINVNNLIQGSGQIGNNNLPITNQPAGVINANGQFPLQLNSGVVTNQGLLEATAGGNLQLYVTVVNQSGTIATTGASSNVQLFNGSQIQGGALSESAGGLIGSAAGNATTLDGTTQGAVTITGTYTVGNSSQTIVVGTINNAGSILVLSNNANAFLSFSGQVTLIGGGSITMSQATSNGQPILNNINNGSLINVNNLIQGSGQLGNNNLPVANESGGVINANGAFPLLFNSGVISNQGLIEATGGSNLQISVLVVNTGATILATGTGSSVQFFNGTSIRGGTLNIATGATIGSAPGNSITLDGSATGTLTIIGTYTVSNTSQTIVVGTINNTGSILVLSNNANTFLSFSGQVTLIGGGSITMSQASSNGQPILNNINNGSLINVNNLIQGSGQLGNNNLPVTNQSGGVINANGAFPLVFNSGVISNQGLIEATGGSNLQISVLVVNTGATILATGTGSSVQFFNGTSIRGGTLNIAAGASMNSVGANVITLDGISSGPLTINGGYTVSNSSQTILVGTINNTGNILVGSNGSNTFLTSSGTVTLIGGGSVSMSQAISTGQPILNNSNNGALININNLIHGAGQLGNNTLPITNQANGVIDADGAFPLQMNNGLVTNLGLIEATGGATLQVSVLVNNKGGSILSNGTGSAIVLFGGANIEGGTLNTAGGGAISSAAGNTSTLDGAAQGALTIAGTYTVSNGSQTVLTGTINNTGTIRVLSTSTNTFLIFSGAVTLTGGGTVQMSQAGGGGQPILNNANSGSLSNVNNLIEGSGQLGNNGLVVVNGPAGTINANGQFPLQMTVAAFTNQGLLAANGALSPGAIATSGYNQTASGGLQLAIGGTTALTQYSQMQNLGNAFISGALDLVFLNGFQPAPGNQFTVLTSTGTISGQFTAINSSALAPGLAWSATYNTNSVVVSVVTGGGGTSALSIAAFGTGSGTVTDNLGQINCVSTAGVASGTCSASYPTGTVVSLVANHTGPSAFVGWGNACTGIGPCSVTLNNNQAVSASFAPPPQLVNLTFNPGTNVTGMAAYDCPSNPNPSPGNPCLDANAYALALAIPQVLVPFTLTVQATEVPPTVADGLCPNGATPSQDFDCRFASFFTYQTLANGDRIVPLCNPYANGNCIHYLVYSGSPGVEPNPNNYVGPIDWTISWNNDLFVPPAPYTGSTPRVYDDPDYAVSPTSPFGTDCNSTMLVGNPPVATAPPISCQFEFDITTGFDPNKKVDAAITARTKQFNDVVVAFPPANVGNLTVTTTAPASVTAGSPLSFSINVSNSAGGSVAGATLSDVLPAAGSLSWSISPAYTGPGTCSITGAAGSQLLGCSFATINPSQTFSISLLSTGSSVGTFTSTGVIQIGNQQILSIGTIAVQPVPVSFSGITPSQSIFVGTNSITLGGIISNGTSFPAPGESVLVTINNVTLNAIIGSNGIFTVSFPTANLPASASPYPITYTFSGDSIFSAASDSTTSLTVSPAPPTLVSITIAPATPTLSVHSTQAFLAIGTYSDGSTQNLTSTVAWNSGTASVATITSTGMATALSSGTSNITATYGNIFDQTQLIVSATAPYAYIGSAVSANCCLDVINTSNNQLVATIPVTTLNEPLGLSPDQTRVFVADNINNLVDVVDTTTNTLRNSIPSGPGATAVVVAPNGNFGYVADLGDNNVLVYDSNYTPVATIGIGFPAGWISITPDGSLVYAGSSIDGRVAVINTSTNSLATTITLTLPPGQLAAGCIIGPAFNPAGTLGYFLQSCASNTAPGFLTVLAIPGNTVVATIPLGILPYDLAITPDGSQVYVVNAKSNNVSVISTSTNTITTTIPVGNAPQSIAVTPDGSTVYVPNTKSNTVSLISTATNTVTSSFPMATPFGIVIASPPPASAFATTLVLTPSNLIFGPLVVSTASTSQTITVRNPSTSAVALTSISFIGPNITDYSLVNSCPQPPATLAAGASCSLQITFKPIAAGTRVALVSIKNNNGVVSNLQSAPFTGTGTGSTVATLSALTPSQSITVGAASINLSGVIGSGTSFPAAGETVAISINGVTQNVPIGSNGAFSTSFPTTAIPVSVTPYTITYSFAGDSTFTSASNSSTTLTVNPVISNFFLTVSAIGTGNGTVTDNLSQINCTTTAGVTSGTCSASYPSGTSVTLTATATSPSTFAAWGNACIGIGSCLVTLNTPQTVTASFAPPPQLVNLTFNPGTNVANMAAYNCPSNPNPSPGNPCLEPNAHAVNLAIPQVLVPFSITVQATEVPPTVADGLCPNAATPSTDFDCRFASFFTYQTLANGDRIVPLCNPYANGNCIHYLVYSGSPGVEPNPNNYVGPIDWNISWNNDQFVPPAPYTGSTPRVYDDPDYAVSPTSPFGTDCNSTMLVGNPPVATAPPISCQFEFDITTGFDPNKKVDAAITARTKQFNDVVVAFPPANVGNLTVTTTAPASVTAGSPLSFSINVSNSAGGSVAGATLSDVLPAAGSLSWSISPAYTGPGTCSITGTVGSQLLGCSFATINPSQTFSISLLSNGSSVGTFTSTGVIQIGNQQILSIGTIAVQPVPVSFSGLAPSQSIFVGTNSITLGGIIGNGTSFPAPGESVLVTINNVTLNAIIGSNGIFTVSFPTANVPVSATPYPITYSFGGDSIFSSVSDNSTSLTVNSLLTQTITFAAMPASASYDSTFAVSASASSGLPVTMVASGVCSLSGTTATMTSGTGTCTLTATQPGNATYAPTQSIKTVAATKATSAVTINSTTPNPSNVSQSVAISITVTGITSPSGSVVVAANTGESCTGALTVGAGICSITFASAGARTLIASYGGDTNFSTSASSSVSQTVNGTTNSNLVISPSNVDFGQVLLGAFSLKTITLSNQGATTITISKISVAAAGNGGYDDFHTQNLCPRNIGAGRSCRVLVEFVPDKHDIALGPQSANLVIASNATGSPQSVPLTAVVINPRASFNPAQLSFGGQKIGTTSASQSVILTNTGTSPLVLQTVDTAGEYALVDGTTCAAGTTLAPTQSCTLRVSFTPKGRRLRLGGIVITDNTLLGKELVILTGVGN